MKTIAVVGNGAIGTLAAVMARRQMPGTRVVLLGRPNRQFSASLAAGAMANVYAEVEDVPQSQNSFQEKSLSIGLRGRAGWRELVAESGNNQIVTCEDTLVYLKKKASPFEQANFEAVVDRVTEDATGELETAAGLERTILRLEDIEAVLRIRGEYGFDTRELFSVLDELITSQGIEVIESEVTDIDSSAPEVHLAEGRIFAADHVLVAAGAETQSLLSHDHLLPMFQGAGLALRVSKDSLPESTSLNEVVRSVNRGGAQCGVHLVPLVDGSIYVGAGNNVLPPGAPPLRFETVRYLLDAVEQEFFGEAGAYSLSGSILLGSRPKTLDGQPVIGPINQDDKVYVISGTNRVGLTWAPALVEDWVSWLGSGQVPTYSSDWKPQRNPIPFSSEQDIISHFARSRAGAAFEHRLIPQTEDAWSRRMSELLEIGSATHVALPENLRFIPPDSWAALEALNLQ